MEYRKKHNYPAIYGSTLKIRDIYPPGAFIFIVEMNNEKNQIEGIGLIENNLVCDRYHNIYSNAEYNTYVYRGKYWLGKENIEPELTEIFNNILFKGKSHLKCRIGITVVTEKLLVRWNYHTLNVKYRLQKLFENACAKNNVINIDKIDNDNNDNDNNDNNDEEIMIVPKKRKRTFTDITNTNIANTNIANINIEK
jgi:hypothetical protein